MCFRFETTPLDEMRGFSTFAVVMVATQKALDVSVPKAASTNEAVKVVSLNFRHAPPSWRPPS